MKIDIEEAIILCMQALNNNKKGTQNVEADYEKVLTILHCIANMKYQGRDLGIGAFGHKDYRSSWNDIYRRFEHKKEIKSSLDWLSVSLLFFDFANFREEEILECAQSIVNAPIMFNHIMKHIVTNLTVINDIDKALELIPNFKKTIIFKEEDNFDQGYLIILKHFALKGDDINFFKYFKLSKPVNNRSEVDHCKGLLVQAFTKKRGLEASLELCKHKNLSKRYHFDALNSFAELGKYQELKSIFVKYPALKQPELETEIKILTIAYLEAINNHYTIDDDFEMLFEKASKISRKLRWGDVKLQDAVFLDLGLANKNDIDRVKMCRKAIKNNKMKKELG